VKGVPQVGKRSWRRNDHERGYSPFPNDLLYCGCNLLGKPVLFDLMPVDRLDCTSLTRYKRLAHPPRALAALLMRLRIFILEDLLGLQIWKLFIAVVP
jgi:hypothetical protein